jgi:hypothetical protein
LFGLFKKKQPPEPPISVPPVPAWKPEIVQAKELIAERVRYYTNQTRDFAVFEHGTIAILPMGWTTKRLQTMGSRRSKRFFMLTRTCIR